MNELLTSQPPPNEQRQKDVRSQFANTIEAFSKPFYQLVLVENSGTFPFITRSVFNTVPALAQVTEGDLALGRGIKGNGRRVLFAENIKALPIDEVIKAQNLLDRIIDISSVIPFSIVKRLKPYLQIELPESKEGLRILGEIAIQVRKDIPTRLDKVPLATNLSSLAQALRLIEDELAARIMANPQFQSDIRELVQFDAREGLLDMENRDDQGQIDRLKNELVQEIISALKAIKVRETVDGEVREFSQFDTELYQIIEQEKLADQASEAREQLSKKIEEREIEVFDAIVRRRVTKKVAGLLLSDSTLRSLGARVADIREEQILTAVDEQGMMLRTQIAKQLIDFPKKKQSRLGLRKTPDFKDIFETERQKMMQAIESNNPFLFAAQLDLKEFELIRARIPNIFRRRMSAENKALFSLAKDTFYKKLSAEIQDEKLIGLIGRKLVQPFVARLTQEMIDQTIQSMGIDLQTLVNDPLTVFDIGDEIMDEVERNVVATTLKKMLSERQMLKKAREQDSSVGTVRFIPPVRTSTSQELDRAFEILLTAPERNQLGAITVRTDIRSSEGPFQYFPDYKIKYPEVVVQAIGDLYAEYNQAFGALADANKEWDTDYQFCFDGPDRKPVNYFVQIDMTGLPATYLKVAANLDPLQVREDLRNRIYEIENSVAMYQLLMKNFSLNGQPSHFEQKFRHELEDLRRRYKKPIALLAVTEGKYQLMRESEFGIKGGQSLSDAEVESLSGFDTFFSPEKFERYVKSNGGNCDYLLYVRSSEPIAKLRDPDIPIDQPLLADPEMRRIIKANTVTFNIDDPNLPLGSPRRINDTKAYLVSMGMAFPIYTFKDFRSEGLIQFLLTRGVKTDLIQSGQIVARAKPMLTSYGCYGHLRGSLHDSKFRQRLIHELKRRGPYVIQPEMSNTLVINDSDGKQYAYIDRNFFSFVNGIPSFMGGERTLMPINSQEVMSGRIHGNETSITAEVS